MKTVCIILLTALLGIFALPALATDTGPCIDPMGCPETSQGQDIGAELDPNGLADEPPILLAWSCENDYDYCSLSCQEAGPPDPSCGRDCLNDYLDCKAWGGMNFASLSEERRQGR